jgi:hypothetical protein
MIKFRSIQFLVIFLFSTLSFAVTDSCKSTDESRQAIEAYLALDVQGSKSIGLYILNEIKRIQMDDSDQIIEISGNVYVLKLSKNTVELETEYADPSDSRVVDGLLITKHSLCEFETMLTEHIRKLN